MSDIILFANGRVGFEICNYLHSINENIQLIYIIDSDDQYAEKIKNSFVPYLLFTSRKYFRSGSPSINKVSDEASNLKSLV